MDSLHLGNAVDAVSCLPDRFLFLILGCCLFMANSGSHFSTADFLPDWSTRHFYLLDPSGIWAPLVSLEIADRWGNRIGVPRVTGIGDSRQLLAGNSIRTAEGLILFCDQIEKECLSVLSRLMDLGSVCPVAAALKEHHRDLIPVLLESGVTSIIMEPTSDVPLADWCLAIFDLSNSKSGSRQGGSTDSPTSSMRSRQNE